jgi:hypothetical protein
MEMTLHLLRGCDTFFVELQQIVYGWDSCVVVFSIKLMG